MRGENGLYQVRACHGHFHVMCGDLDLICGPYATEIEAQAFADVMNRGITEPGDQWEEAITAAEILGPEGTE